MVSARRSNERKADEGGEGKRLKSGCLQGPPGVWSLHEGEVKTLGCLGLPFEV